MWFCDEYNRWTIDSAPPAASLRAADRSASRITLVEHLLSCINNHEIGYNPRFGHEIGRVIRSEKKGIGEGPD
jgi:hypothetical protein